MKSIVIFGKPGCGKDTQNNLIAEKFKIPQLNVGEIIRNKQELLNSEEIESVKQGNLLSDETINRIVYNELKNNNYLRLLFNGYPRTQGQAEELLKISPDPILINLEISDSVAESRLLNRKDNREDDLKEVIQKRLDNYHKTTAKIIEFFKKQNIPIININGEKSIEEIHDEICNKITNKI